MKLTPNFDAREFVGETTWKAFGENSTWFINPKIPALAEFYKSFFLNYYQQKYAAQTNKVVSVLIVVNNWHYVKGGYQDRGFRLPNSKTGAELSQHKFTNAFDCDIVMVFADGTKLEADYKEIHQVIMLNEALFISKGLAAIESVEIAKTWLHSDCRWIPGQTKILIVKPK